MALTSVSHTDRASTASLSTEKIPARLQENRRPIESQKDRASEEIEDKVTLHASSKDDESGVYSPQSMNRGKTGLDAPELRETQTEENETKEDETEESDEEKKGSEQTQKNGELTQEEQTAVAKLKARDTEVKAHEQAHIAAGGQYVRGGASFQYKTGPDGEKYAVGGEVSIDVSRVSDNPEATIAKMQVVLRSALAPASPSAQDRSVAASATRIANDARAEMMKNNTPDVSPEETGKDQGESVEETAGQSESGKPMNIDLYA